MKNLRDILFSQNEEIVAVLGNNVIQRFLTTGILGNGFAVLSDKRLYFRGKCLHKKGKFYRTNTEEKSVDLKDVTGTGFEHINPIGILVAAIACITIGVMLFVINMSTESFL